MDDRWATLPTSAVTAASTLWTWAHVTVRKGKRERRTGTEDNNNVISTRSHMVETGKGRRGDGGIDV